MLTAVLVLVLGGCAGLQGFLDKGVSEEEAAQIVANRGQQIGDLGKDASSVAPQTYGEALALHREMVYSKERGRSAEVRRLDGQLAPILEQIRASVEASSSKGPSETDVAGLKVQLQAALRDRDAARRQAQVFCDDASINLQQCQGNLSQLQVINQRLEADYKVALNEAMELRTRLQGMASRAEADALYAEARVLVDRMGEEGFSQESLAILKSSRILLEEGRKSLERGNSGGAALAFDRVSINYKEFKARNSRAMTVTAPNVTLRANPSLSAEKVGTLLNGDAVVAVARSGDWLRVKPPSGPEGWLRKEMVR